VVHYEQAFFIRQIIAAAVPAVCLVSRESVPTPSLVPAFYVVVAATGLNLIYYWLTVSGKFRPYFKWAQIALDMLLWTVLVHFTGGRESIFFFLYPLEVLVGAFTLSASGCIYGAGVAALFFTVEAGVLGPHPGLDGNHGVRIVFIFAVAALAVLIVRKLEKKTREVERLGDMLRERAERAETSLSTLLDTVTSGLLVLDDDGKLLSVNEPLARMLGADAQALAAGRDGGGEFARLRLRLVKTLNSGRATESFKFVSSGSHGASRTLEVQARVFGLGGQRCVTAAVSENGPDDAAAGLGSQRRDGETPSGAVPAAGTGPSVSVVAHEVKNSMTCVLGLLSLLKDDVCRDAKSLGLVRKAVCAAEELDAFVSDLLLYSKPAAPRFERVDLVSVVDCVAQCLEGKVLRDKNVTVTRAFSVERLDVEADPRQIHRVAMNLLLNACQAVRDEGNVCLSVTRDGHCAVVEVRDDGCGIPTEAMGRLFEPFFTTKVSGSGLGLPIARNLVMAHRGSIGVKSVPGSGTSVTVRIPIDRSEQNRPEPGPGGPAAVAAGAPSEFEARNAVR
jgi:nitrogen-specific signal transduction histidine kinase